MTGDNEDHGGTVTKVARLAGRLLCVAGLAAWATWIAWHVGSGLPGVMGAVVLLLELLALSVATVITVALWSADPGGAPRGSDFPTVMAAVLGIADVEPDLRHGGDDTGEVALAKRGLQAFDPRLGRVVLRRSAAESAWNLVAVEGVRRMAFVVALVAVLLTGQVPIETPPWEMIAVLVLASVSIAIGHWMLSGRRVLPGARLRWSMASVGAGVGDGRSRTGLPIRWATTMATIVVLNLAVSLRGLSDRWTHGLGPMPHDQRVLVMSLSWWLVVVGFTALRTLERPALGLYGATRRLEEASTRRLALGATLAVAMVGFVAGALP